MSKIDNLAELPWEDGVNNWAGLTPFFEDDPPTFLLTRTEVERPLRGYADAVLMWGTTLVFVVSDNRNAVFKENDATPA